MNETAQKGRIQLLLLVSEDGVCLWSIVEYSDFSAEATERVSQQFQQTKYIPATKGSNSVSALIRIEVNHTLEDD